MSHCPNLVRFTEMVIFCLCLLPATAQTTHAEETSPASSADQTDSGAPPAAEAPTGLWERPNFLGDMGGLRTVLGNYGITFGLTETSEVLGNTTGGLHRGFAYEGLTTMTLTMDTDKAFNWSGGTFNVSALQIHGRNLSADNLDNLQTVSGIEASDSTRLWELWFQQAFLDGKADLKIGQQSIDQEFMTSQCSSLYVNTMMGWPMVPSADLYAGGPAYPLSSLGVRLQGQPTESLKLLGGVFNDNPPGGPFNDDSQLRGNEASGVRFNLNTGALFIGEVQYLVNPPSGDKNTPSKDTGGLPGTYKLGAWYDTGNFFDQRFDTGGLSLANPASNSHPRTYGGNFSIYSVADQMVWRQSDGPRSIGVFARIMGAPADRNLIDWSLNAGVNLKGLVPGRDDDTFGIGYGWAHVSNQASDLDRDTGVFKGTVYPIRDSEQFIEVTYQYQVAPWWIIQPDMQYIINPGGGLSNPLNPSERIGNELVVGIRTTIIF
ncbi:MAG: carbohydrate porin [Desulfocapsaceae bacterium]|nr:carbohydrate porin [Desulfocapsaceae bacterium]